MIRATFPRQSKSFIGTTAAKDFPENNRRIVVLHSAEALSARTGTFAAPHSRRKSSSKVRRAVSSRPSI